MDCPKCGTWNPDDKQVCWRCQTEMPKPVEIKKSKPRIFLGLPRLGMGDARDHAGLFCPDPVRRSGPAAALGITAIRASNARALKRAFFLPGAFRYVDACLFSTSRSRGDGGGDRHSQVCQSPAPCLAAGRPARPALAAAA